MGWTRGGVDSGGLVDMGVTSVGDDGVGLGGIVVGAGGAVVGAGGIVVGTGGAVVGTDGAVVISGTLVVAFTTGEGVAGKTVASMTWRISIDGN